jgi:hypothetical protein
MVFKIFSPNFFAKMAFLTQNKAKLCKKLIITLVFEKNAFFCQKSQKIVIITSTTGHPVPNQKLAGALKKRGYLVRERRTRQRMVS